MIGGVRLLQSVKWLWASVLLLLSLPLLSMISFLVALALPERGAMLLYNFAFSVFPHACPQGLDIGVCSVLSGWPENWSFVVWAVVAISFGWFTRGLSWRTKLGVGVVAVALTILAMQAGMPLFGFQHYVDAL